MTTNPPQNRAQRLMERIRITRIPVLRGRYILRHKGKSLRRHRFNAMFDDIRVLTEEQAEARMATIMAEMKDTAITQQRTEHMYAILGSGRHAASPSERAWRKIELNARLPIHVPRYTRLYGPGVALDS